MRLSRAITVVVLAGVLALILSACGARTRLVEETAIARASTVTLPTAIPQPSATATIQPTATPQPTHTPTATPTATATPSRTPTASPTATATATPPNPLSVAYMREQAYPGERDRDREEARSRAATTSAIVLRTSPRGLKIIRAADRAQRHAKPATGWPAIVFNHGYIPPARIPDDRAPTSRYVDGFARNGYIVFQARLSRP